MKKADIGLIGLAVMGENLVMNMESKGFTVAVYNRTTEKTDRFIAGRAAGKNIIGCHTLEEFVSQLERPRKVFMMVKAGQAVDDMIEQLLPLLDDYDILIDGGNSHFPDTIRRTAYVESKGKLYIGTGVSGGEEGALKGPSMMPGGSPVAWPYVKPIFQAICAKVEDGSPCCEWVGENGAGHFVKMVHNGIEYGDILGCTLYKNTIVPARRAKGIQIDDAKVEKTTMNILKYSTFVIGLIAVPIAFNKPANLTAMLWGAAGPIMSAVAGPVVIGIFSKRPSAKAAALGSVLGCASFLILYFAKIIGSVYLCCSIGGVVSILFCVIGMYVFPPMDEKLAADAFKTLED